MCIPLAAAEQASPHFALPSEIAKRNAIPVLSVGTSADFELTIRSGATHVRGGTTIFGKRRGEQGHSKLRAGRRRTVENIVN